MRQAQAPRGKDESTEPVAQILRIDQGRSMEAPPPPPVPLHRVPPAGWYADRLRFWDGRDWTVQVRPVEGLASVMRVSYEDAPEPEPATEAVSVEAETVVPAEVGLLGMPAVIMAGTRGRRRIPTPNLRPGLQWIMRGFARRSKNEKAMVDEPDAGDPFALDNLLGEDAAGTEPDAPTEPATESEAPAAVEEPAAAGWYQDPSDPEAIRYWDGSGWTGLVTPRPPPLSALGDSAATAETVRYQPPPPVPGASNGDEMPPAPTSVGDGAADEFSGWRADPFHRYGGRYFDRGQPTNRVRDGSRFFYDVLPPGGPPSQEVGTAVNAVPAPTPPPPRVAPAAGTVPDAAPEGHNWAQEAEMAATRARTVDTPESWQQAARAAVVLSEMAQVMLVAAEAKQTAEQSADAARVASEAAAAAKLTAEQSADAADEAARVASAAAQAAAEAKRMAERSAQAVPGVARAARVASEAAAAATHQAQELEETVAKARAVDTPEAWSEALRLAIHHVGGGDQRDPDSDNMSLRSTVRPA